MFFQKKPKQYIPQTEVGQNIMKIREILIKIEEMKRNQREEMKQKKIELIKIDTNGVLQEQSFKPSEGIIGIYHHVSKKHLQGYINEFCFRYNNRGNIMIFDNLIKNSIC